MLDDLANDLAGAGAVIDGDAHVEVAGVIRALVNLLAEGAESAAEGGLVLREAMAGAEVCEIEEDIWDGIGSVLNGGGDGEALAIIKEGKEDAAGGGGAIRGDQAEATPCEGGGDGDGGDAAV